MIGVKGIRASQAKPNETDRYEVTGLAAVSRIPAVLAALTAGVALYLKSFLPVWADTPAPPRPGAAGQCSGGGCAGVGRRGRPCRRRGGTGHGRQPQPP
jgi:hypothetical protein